MPGAMGQVHHFKGCLDVSAPFRFGQMGQEQRQLHVPLRGEDRKQIVELEHEPDMTRSPGRQLATGHLVNSISANLNHAAAGRDPVHRSN